MSKSCPSKDCAVCIHRLQGFKTRRNTPKPFRPSSTYLVLRPSRLLFILQGGSADLLAAKDVTGSIPSKLASDKGHRYLAHYLEDAQKKEDKSKGVFGKAGILSFLTSTQLCPIIWLIIIGLVALFVYKVSLAQLIGIPCTLHEPHMLITIFKGNHRGYELRNAWMITTMETNDVQLVFKYMMLLRSEKSLQRERLCDISKFCHPSWSVIFKACKKELHVQAVVHLGSVALNAFVLKRLLDLQVVQHSTLPELGFWAMSTSWLCIITASSGLVLLYRITKSDPGFLPRSNGSSSAARSQALRKPTPSKSTKGPLDQILGRYNSPFLFAVRFHPGLRKIKTCMSCCTLMA